MGEEVRDLAVRVDSSIRATRAVHLDRVADESADRANEFPLNGRPVALCLPAEVVRAVVLNAEPDVTRRSQKSSSAISTALRAAPLRIWSPTTHRS